MFRLFVLMAILLGFCKIALTKENANAIVSEKLQSILAENDFNTRVARAQDLRKSINGLDKSAIDEISCNTIDKLNQAIATEKPPVRAQLAQVAGAIGSRASASLPALKKALADELSPPDIGPFDPLPAWDDSKIYSAAIRKIETDGTENNCSP